MGMATSTGATELLSPRMTKNMAIYALDYPSQLPLYITQASDRSTHGPKAEARKQLHLETLGGIHSLSHRKYMYKNLLRRAKKHPFFTTLLRPVEDARIAGCVRSSGSTGSHLSSNSFPE